MTTLLDLLEQHIFSGIPSQAVYDLLKTAWGIAHSKTWESLYLDSFKQALKDSEPFLEKYGQPDGEVLVLEKELENALEVTLQKSLRRYY